MRSAAGLEQTPTQGTAAVEHAQVTTEFSNGAAIQAEIQTESAASAEPASVPLPGQAADPESLRSAIAAALATGGHDSAGQLLSTAVLAFNGSALRIEVPGVGKKMLSLTINAAAEKIIRQELQRMVGPARFMVVPGEGAAPAAAAAAPVPAGSIHQAALAHPLVQRAREIFNAEIRSVVDLHSK
jgi:DNA polymerase III subunit gamma/tau